MPATDAPIVEGIQARAKTIGDYLISKGFPYVKVEIEADVQPENYKRQSECHVCSGTGNMECETCHGIGTIRICCRTCMGKGIS